MTLYRFVRKQFLPITIYRAWDFFSSPKNLLLVTPQRLDVAINEYSDTERIHEGQIIKLRVTVLPFVRIDWETTVSDISYYECFTLLQRKGPYSHWAHTHRFRSLAGGTELSDEVEYALPYGVIGRVSQSILVKRELKKVFDYRANVIKEYFENSRILIPVMDEMRSQSS